MSFVSDLEPGPLWRHFDEILKIPRGSKNEERVRRHVIDVAERNGARHRVDAAGNLVVRKPASAGREGAPITVLQAHLDMVNEKNSDVRHDFEKDPIIPRRAGEYLTASGTTLGSDNGIGVAAMLAVIEDRALVHGPLELLFTIDEETGLSGAAGLGPDMLEGRRLLNLDSEEEDLLTIGCAGGADTRLTLPLAEAPVPGGAQALGVELAGLRGGHSGIDIHLQRGNAVKLLGRALYAASLAHPFRLAHLAGGDKHNAIPREARATLVAEPGALAALREALEAELQAVRAEYRGTDPDARYRVDPAEPGPGSWSASSTARVLGLVQALPHGVEVQSREIPGFVETSTNLAAVAERDGALHVLMSSRSSIASALDALRQRIRATATLAGAEVEERPGYPGWQANIDSELLRLVRTLRESLTGRPPRIGAVHAGLECGIIGKKFPDMDMISFGPQIEFPHSPDERVHIDSVGRFYRLLTTTLEKLAG
jgi:dipeptidase D